MALSQPESQRRCEGELRVGSYDDCTVEIARCDSRVFTTGACIRRAGSSTALREAPQGTPPVLEHLDGLLTPHRREVVEKLVEAEPGLEVLDQGIDRNARAAEDNH